MISDQVFASASNRPLTIRPYETQDQTAVRDLFIRVNRELAPAHLKEQFEAYIALSLREEIDRIPNYYAASRGASFWVAIDAGGLVGNFGLEPIEAGLELRRMYVDPRARRQGLGRLMLADAERVASQQGHSRIVLSTSELQTAAIRLYRAFGYHLVREEVATTATNKTVGSDLRRYHFEKHIVGGTDFLLGASSPS
jgi:GNAT superfamily N-acetyltransferase